MNDSRPLVSVIIPLYNQERYLDACMCSVCRQTYSNLQVIIVDDGSSDRSPQMADNWAASDDRLLVLHKSNEGTAFARRDGLAKATGDYVMFVDSDDLIPRDAVAILVNLATTHNVDLVTGSVTRKLGFTRKRHCFDAPYDFPIDRVVKNPELFDKHFLGFFGNNTFAPMMTACIFRKCVIDKANEEVELFSKDIRIVGEDSYFVNMLFPYLNSMYRTLETVYIYRYGGLTSNYNSHYHELFAYCDKRLQMLDERGLTEHCEPLFWQYANMVYEEAIQLIKYKHATKDEVISFFKDEMASREIAKRMVDYFSNRETPFKGARLMAGRDFEGMYGFAYNRYVVLQKSWKYRAKKMYLKMINMFS